MYEENPFKTINRRIKVRFNCMWGSGAVGSVLRVAGIIFLIVMIIMFGTRWARTFEAWPGIPMLFGSWLIAGLLGWYLKTVNDEYERNE